MQSSGPDLRSARSHQDYKLTVTTPAAFGQPVRKTRSTIWPAPGEDRRSQLPPEFSDTPNFSPIRVRCGGDGPQANVALTKNLNDAAAMAVVNRDKALHSMLRTTCVATMIDGGHAVNALPQKVEANVNCRILPGHTPAQIKDQLARVIDNEAIAIRFVRDDKPLAQPPDSPAPIGR